MKRALLLVYLLWGLLGNLQNAVGQSSVRDSLVQKLTYFAEKDSTLKTVVAETLTSFTSGKMNDTLARRLLLVDSLLISAVDPEMPETLYFTELLVHALKDLPQQSAFKYATALTNLAGLYSTTGQYNKALPLYLQALPIIKNALGEQHPAYITSLYKLGALYNDMGQYPKALSLLEQALALGKRVLGEEHTEYANILHNLAGLYRNTAQYDKALPLFEQALSIRKKRLGEEHAAYSTSLNDLGALYREMGQYDKALPLYQQSLDITEKVNGKENPDYAASLNNLADLYGAMGQYEKGIPLFQEVLALAKKLLGEEHPYYAFTLSNLSELYKNIGHHEKALLLCKQALQIVKKSLGEAHPYYASSLNNVAVIYKSMGRYEQAIPLYEEALALRKKGGGEGHPDYALSLNNLATAYYMLGQNEKALPLFQEGLALRKKAFGEEHPDVAASLGNLAALYHSMMQYDKALPLYRQALAIRKKVLGEEHSEYISNLNYLGLLYAAQDNSSDAAASFIKANKNILRYLDRTYSILSEKEKIELLERASLQFSSLPSLLFFQNYAAPQVTQQIYTNELTLKGMVLHDQQNVLRSIYQSGDSKVEKLYEQWRTNKTVLGKQLLLPISKRISYLDSLQDVTNQHEQELSRRAVSFNDFQRSQAIAANDILAKLTEGKAAIEFIRFTYFNKKWTDTVMYAALMLLPGDSVCKFIPLCEEGRLKKFTGSAAIKASGSLNDSLYKLIWKPLEKYLTGTNTVYYAPAGLLHRISFQSLRCDPKHLLIDKYQLNQVLSTRSVALQGEPPLKPALAHIWGNIDYNPETPSFMASRGEANNSSTDTSASSFNLYTSDTRGMRDKGWPSLPGTKQEMNSITKLLKQAGVEVVADSDSMATEEAFKALDGKSPQILHLATHGFFLPITANKLNTNTVLNSGRGVFTMQQNPLFRSGLVLAGGNRTWKGELTTTGKEDGILTAYEIAQMNLSNTGLVVLSACETALGDLQGNEGVFGLQRAFKLAGVKQMIMSLWKVPDAETTVLMTLFYRNWLGGQTTREALRSAQLKMKKKYPPEKWAAFVLVE